MSRNTIKTTKASKINRVCITGKLRSKSFKWLSAGQFVLYGEHMCKLEFLGKNALIMHATNLCNPYYRNSGQ